MGLSQTAAIGQALEIAQILDSGRYTDAHGAQHDISQIVRESLRSTREYPPSWQAGALPAPRFSTRLRLLNTPTFAEARALFEAGGKVAALNFASARNPGGGFLNGARAQEEALCRESTLYACLEKQPNFYRFHRKRAGAEDALLYSSWALFSPRVAVIRDCFTHQLAPPFEIAVITAAAPNRNLSTPFSRPLDDEKVSAAFAERIRKILSIALENGCDSLVLGAWGCGAFRNDPSVVAAQFAHALREFDGQFRTVSFAVLDRAPFHNFNAFHEVFGENLES